jgi:hypothetical protein
MQFKKVKQVVIRDNNGNIVASAIADNPQQAVGDIYKINPQLLEFPNVWQKIWQPSGQQAPDSFRTYAQQSAERASEALKSAMSNYSENTKEGYREKVINDIANQNPWLDKKQLATQVYTNMPDIKEPTLWDKVKEKALEPPKQLFNIAKGLVSFEGTRKYGNIMGKALGTPIETQAQTEAGQSAMDQLFRAKKLHQEGKLSAEAYRKILRMTGEQQKGISNELNRIESELPSNREALAATGQMGLDLASWAKAPQIAVGAAKAASPLMNIAKAAGQGAAFGGSYRGLEALGQKEMPTPGQVASETLQGAGVGALLGGGLAGAGAVIGKMINKKTAPVVQKTLPDEQINKPQFNITKVGDIVPEGKVIPKELQPLIGVAQKSKNINEFIKKIAEDDYAPIFRNPVADAWRNKYIKPLQSGSKPPFSSDPGLMESNLNPYMPKKYTQSQLENMSVKQKAEIVNGKEWTKLYEEMLNNDIYKFQRNFYTQATQQPVKELAQTAVQQPEKVRQFINTVKQSPNTAPGVAGRVSGTYIPRSNDELAKTAKSLINKDINKARDMAIRGGSDDSVATAAQLIVHYQNKKDFASAVQIADQAAKNLTELGRGVQAASLYNKLSPEGIVRFAQTEIQKAEKTGRKIPTLAPEKAQELTGKAKLINKMPDGQEKTLATSQLLDDVKAVVPSTAGQKIVAVWKAGLLTNPSTSAVNILSNLTHNVAETIKDIPASAIDKISSLFTKKRTLGLTGRGTVTGFKEGWKKAGTYLKTGFDERNVAEKYDFRKVNFTSKPGKALQKYEESMFRLMGGEDQVFYYASKARSLFSQGIAQGKNKGLKGKELKSFVDDFVKKPPEDALGYAVYDAEMSVFQNKTFLGVEAQGLVKHAKKVRMEGAVEWALPFRRTPAAVATQIINYSPAGIPKAIIHQIRQKHFTQREFAQAMGRGITGTALWAIGGALFDAGLMTLGTPQTEKERNQWELEGKQQGSIKVGDKWLQLNALGPIGLTMVLGGYFKQALNKTGSPMAAIYEATTGTAKTVVDQSFLKGLSAIINTTNDPKRYAQQLYEQTAGSVVPSVIAGLARATDPYQREVEGGKQSIMSRIPGLREMLPERLTALGEPVERGIGPVETMVSPFRPTKAKTSPLIEEMARVGVTPTKMDKQQSIGGKKLELNQDELQNLRKASGTRIKEAFTNIINSPQYASMSQEDKEKTLAQAITDIRAVEKAKSLMGNLSDEEKKKALAKLTGKQEADYLGIPYVEKKKKGWVNYSKNKKTSSKKSYSKSSGRKSSRGKKPSTANLKKLVSLYKKAARRGVTKPKLSKPRKVALKKPKKLKI